MGATELVEPRRQLIYVCPACGDREVAFLAPCPECDIQPPAMESIECHCGPCFSAKLDRAMPGARERYQRRMERLAKKAAEQSNEHSGKVNH